MQVIKVEKNSEEWLRLREGKISGAKSGDIVSESGLTVEAIKRELDNHFISWDKKMLKPQLDALLPLDSRVKLMLQSKKTLAYYQLMADKIALKDDTVDGMERGHALEDEALDAFEKASGKTLYRDPVLLISDENPNISVSPDSMIQKEKKFVEAVEVKCLGSAKYLKAYYEQQIPSEYEEQVIQYFIVNPDFERLYFVFYDPRITAKPIHWIVVERSSVANKIPLYLEIQKQVLEDIDQKVLELTF